MIHNDILNQQRFHIYVYTLNNLKAFIIVVEFQLLSQFLAKISTISSVLCLDMIHSVKYLFPSVLKVLVLHLSSKIFLRSNSFLSLTKSIIFYLNSLLFASSLFKYLLPHLFKVPLSSSIFSSCISETASQIFSKGAVSLRVTLTKLFFRMVQSFCESV